jgi:hypothetical protein
VPFLPGNHDIGDNPIAPGAPTKHALDLARLEEYRVLFGPDRWSFHTGAWQVIGVNAQLFGTATGRRRGNSPGSNTRFGAAQDRSG